MTTYIDNVEMATEVCYKCAMVFGMPRDFQRRRLNDRTSFFCPAGHQQHYTGKTEEQRLKEEVERQKSMREAAEARASKATKDRDEVARAHSRMRVRVINGVCICCNRTFQNLLRHMQTEHPEAISLKVMREAFGMTQSALADEIGVSPTIVSWAERGTRVGARSQARIDAWLARHDTASSKEIAS